MIVYESGIRTTDFEVIKYIQGSMMEMEMGPVEVATHRYLFFLSREGGGS